MSRQVGLKDFTIAMVTSDTPTIGAVAGAIVYAAPQKIERSIKAVLKPKSTTTKLYSDDSVEEVVTLLDSIEVTIELNQLSVESRALLQGSTVVKGVLLETKDDVAPTLAIGFRSKKTNKKFRYVWLYKGSFEITEDTYETEEDKTKAQTATLVGTFYPRESDGAFRIIADEDSELMEPAFITSFFTAVAEQPTVI